MFDYFMDKLTEEPFSGLTADQFLDTHSKLRHMLQKLEAHHCEVYPYTQGAPIFEEICIMLKKFNPHVEHEFAHAIAYVSCSSVMVCLRKGKVTVTIHPHEDYRLIRVLRKIESTYNK